MTKTYVNPPDLFDSRQYGFSQAVIATGRKTVYCSGQVAWDADQDIGAGGDLHQQTLRALANVGRVVAAAGGTLRDVVSLRIYIVNSQINATRGVRDALLESFPPEALPATTWLAVPALANPDFLIEIEAVAVLD